MECILAVKVHKGDSEMRKVPISETEREVWRQLKSQQKKGRDRYKVAMSYKQNGDPVAWAQEIVEELVDALQYAVAFKLSLQAKMKGSKRESNTNKSQHLSIG